MATLLKPERTKQAMRELVQVTIAFAEAQIESGADAITLADHCTRDLCSPDAYRDFLADIHSELHERIRCPLILHICGDTSDRLEYIRATGPGPKSSYQGGSVTTQHMEEVVFGCGAAALPPHHTQKQPFSPVCWGSHVAVKKAE